MTKTKVYLMLILGVLVLSCSENEITTYDAVQETKILKFASRQEMNYKIDEIEEFQKDYESEIFEKILHHNKITKSSFDEVVKSKETKLLEDINKEQILEDLKFYHKEKIKSIYELREFLNFTSLQSVVDEIESLRLLNPSKAEVLFNKHSKFLRKTSGVVTSIYHKRISMSYTTGILASNPNQYYTEYRFLAVIPYVVPLVIPYPFQVNGFGNRSFVDFTRVDSPGLSRTIPFPNAGFGASVSNLSPPFNELQQGHRYEPVFGQISTFVTTVLGSQVVSGNAFANF